MSKLALLGGPKAIPAPVRTKNTAVSPAAMEAVMALMQSGRTSAAPVVGEFERRFAEYLGVKYCVAVNSGTNSLHEALFAVGVGPGDEVLVPSFTWIFSVAPVLACHGVPVFCDVDLDTQNIDPRDIRRKITPRTKAILVVHVWGNPVQMDEIMEIAREHDLRVIEDCAHAHGSLWRGRKVGGIGDAGGYSLQGSKTLVAGEGGAFVTNTREYYERAIALGHYERVSRLPEDSPYRKYTTSLGYKHRCHPFGIAMANAELDNLDEANALRAAQGRYFEEGIADIPCVKTQKVYPGGTRQYSYQYGRFDGALLGGVSTMTFLNALKSEGVAVGMCGYGYLHEAPLFVEQDPFGRGCPGRCPHYQGHGKVEIPSLPNTEYLRENSFLMAPRFELPCRELLDQYIEAYHKVAANADELLAYERDHGVARSNAADSGRSVNLL